MANFKLNPKVTHAQRGKETVRNPEGGLVYKTPADISLFLNASAFKIKNSFYYGAEETLNSLEQLIDTTNDVQYNLAVAKFLSEVLGIRLSPVLIVTREALRTKGGLDPRARDLIKAVVPSVFDRPDKITNALAYTEYLAKTFKVLPPYYKKALRDAFEKFDPYTLRKFKLARRSVKTSDVIKALRPRPRNAQLSALYRAILENSHEAAIEKDTVITEVLSDSSKTEQEKKAWVGVNLAKIPFNALIRNLTNVEVTSENLITLSNRFTSGLRVVNGLPSVKVANPFDLLTAAENSKSDKIMSIADQALGNFVSKVELGLEGADVSVLIDISGSMGPYYARGGEQGIHIAAKYMSLLLPMLKDSNLKLYAFNTRVINKTDRVPLYKRMSISPVAVKNMFLSDFAINGGTSLADSVREVAKQDNPDLLIVISDEVSWADKYGQNTVAMFDVGVSVIAINPYPQGQFTVFDPHKPIVRLSSLDAKIFYYIPMLANFNKFKSWLKNWAFG